MKTPFAPVVSARFEAPAKTPSSLSQRVIGASVLWWLVALGFLAWSVTMKPGSTEPFWVLTRDYDLTAGWFGLGVFAGAWGLSRRLKCDWTRMAQWIEARLVWLCAGAFLLYAALAFWAYHHHPLSMDEYGPWSQSRAFAAGRISAAVPPAMLEWILPSWYRGEFFADSRSSGHFTSAYWPALAISQTPFALLGLNWLCNPAWGALGLWGVFRLAKRLTGSSEVAAWAWALTLASPVIAINAASFYAMPAHLACSVFYALLLLRDDRRGAFWAGVLGGFALVLHNPVPHLSFALPWIVFIAWKRRGLLGPLLVGYLVFALPLGFGWSAFLDGFDASKYAQAAHASSQALPFAEMLGRLERVVRPPSLYLVFVRLMGLAKTVVWAVPGLPVLAWMGWRSLKQASSDGLDAKLDGRGLRLLGASLFSTFMIYWLVPFDQGHGWGFRYIHSAWFVLAILAGLTLARDVRGGDVRGGDVRGGDVRGSDVRGSDVRGSDVRGSDGRPFFAALCVLSLAVMLPLRAWQVESFVGRQLHQIPAVPATAPVSITFVNPDSGWFSYDLVQNDPFLRNDDWRLLSHGAARNARLARTYLVEPTRLQSGQWGEIWGGRALRHPGLP